MDLGPKAIKDFKTLNGSITVQAARQASLFCDSFSTLIDRQE